MPVPPKYSEPVCNYEACSNAACVCGWLADNWWVTILEILGSLLKTSAELRLENLALRHQLGVVRRSAPKRLKLTPAD